MFCSGRDIDAVAMVDSEVGRVRTVSACGSDDRFIAVGGQDVQHVKVRKIDT